MQDATKEKPSCEGLSIRCANWELELFLEQLLGLGAACNRASYNEARQCDEGDGIGENHQLVAHVLKLPDDVVLQQSAQEDEECCRKRKDKKKKKVKMNN